MSDLPPTGSGTGGLGRAPLTTSAPTAATGTSKVPVRATSAPAPGSSLVGALAPSFSFTRVSGGASLAGGSKVSPLFY